MQEHRDSGGRFTGYRRARTPRRTVLAADRLARWVITMGGLGGIVAVSLVGLFLVWVVLPLFLPPSMPPVAEGGDAAAPHGAVQRLGADEDVLAGWSYLGGGRLEVRRLSDGAVMERRDVDPRRAPSATSFPIQGEQCAFGFADGTVRLGRIAFASTYLADETAPPALHDLAPGATALVDSGIVVRTDEGQLRAEHLLLELDEPVALSDTAVVLIDQSATPGGPMLAALTADGVLHVSRVSRRKNLLTGAVTTRMSGGSLKLKLAGCGPPSRLLLTGLGDNVLLAWDDGRLRRYDTRSGPDPVLVEELDLAPAEGRRLTALSFQIGKASLVAGDDAGALSVWFRIRPEQGAARDGTRLVMARRLQEPLGTPVTALAPSARTRLVAAGYADGAVRLYHVTSGRRLAEGTLPGPEEPIRSLAIAPRDDALLAAGAERLGRWRIDAPHPETSFASLLLPVWYEGYDAPALVWQSSSATDDFEPKYSLAPLIFGTLKATVYAMLIALPLALLAALYTSEFLHARLKARIKPAIEMMASLPSVVLGFLGALVFAPVIERIVPQTLAGFVAVPFAFLLGAHLWQLLPRTTAARLERWKLIPIALMLPAGIGLAAAAGGPVENLLFAGDVKAWLDGQAGTGLGAWMILLVPASALAVALLVENVAHPWLRRVSRDWSRTRFVLADLAKFLAAAAATLALAAGVSWLLTSLGWDPRGGVVGTYVQRNALVVGFVMGFAVIPIIYTIAEDALAAVPEHLRAASLGAGATPWQTALRVVVPPATSGLFSAVMIGLGRAVGETMIVLMAAGNTPIMSWNIFDGFRTLSANIAVELPEAVQNSTHYRTLFLAALTLFVMTFILNTVAEAVRIRFRRKAYEL